MINISNYNNTDFANEKISLKEHFKSHIKKHVELPAVLKEAVFPEPFFTGEQYLVFPFLLRKAFGDPSNAFMSELSIAGYLHFRYLISIDNLIDNDITEQNKSFVPAGTLVLRAHIYHEESMKILSSLFTEKSPFWITWKKRNRQFYDSILIDKKYDLEMDFSIYKILSSGKCSFLKAAIDALYHKMKLKDKKLYDALIISFDHLATGRCLQDDLEDFKKDIIHKKNNHAHVMLNQWFKLNGKTFELETPGMLEKYFFTSGVAEELMEKSKVCFNLAIEAVKEFNLLPEYTRYIETLRNKCILVKLNIKAYTAIKLIESIKTPILHKYNSVSQSISGAETYIKKMQNPEGSWQEVCNKFGLSNVWATAYIAMNLNATDPAFTRAAHFLNNNKQFGAWGWNTDWVPDFDSATCSLSVLSKANFKIDHSLKTWLEGQGSTGGFSTYRTADKLLTSHLAVKDNLFINEWSKEHICVSALAYYFLSGLKKNHLYEEEIKNLRRFLLNAVTKDGTWEPYWWTSVIYPTTYIIKGMLKENNTDDRKIIHKAAKNLVARQQADGSFTCDVLKTKNVFYTSLVLDTLCLDKELFKMYGLQVEKMKNWILGRQYKDGSFENSNYILHPHSPVDSQKTDKAYKINNVLGAGSITGDIAGLFSTVSAYKALTNYEQIIPQLT